jgi:hypothetical protein
VVVTTFVVVTVIVAGSLEVVVGFVVGLDGVGCGKDVGGLSVHRGPMHVVVKENWRLERWSAGACWV